jgi:hypothetical protein
MTTARTAELNSFLDLLTRLYQKAGCPSYRHMSDEITGVHHTTIADCMSGRTIPRWQSVVPIIAFLGGRPEDFQRAWQTAKAAQAKKIRERRVEAEWHLNCAVCIIDGAKPLTATTVMDGDAVCHVHAAARRAARLEAAAG